MNAIEVRGLSKRFVHRFILNEVELDVAEGESVAVQGANGSGKTTLLRCLGAVIRPTRGNVRWFGRSAASDPRTRCLVGMVAHESRLYPHLTLRENLVFAARMYSLPNPQRRVDEVLAETGLGLHGNRTPPELSRGMQQRLAIARAVIHDPPILVMDEPFTGLDSEGVDWLRRLLAERRKCGKTLCVALHDEETTQALADRIFLVRQGRVESRWVEHPRAARAA